MLNNTLDFQNYLINIKFIFNYENIFDYIAKLILYLNLDMIWYIYNY
jgi:hypothetical protein